MGADVLGEAIRVHLLEGLRTTSVRTEPYDHAFASDLFPPAFCEELRNRRPAAFLDSAEGQRLGNAPCDGRRQVVLSDRVLAAMGEDLASTWRRAREVLNHPDVIAAYRALFDAALRRAWPHELEEPLLPTLSLAWERAGFGLAPHTEAPNKRVQALYYLADPDADPSLGTGLYVPRQPGTECDGHRYHPREEFLLHGIAPYRVNSAFLFIKSRVSFHGVETFHRPGAERWVLVHTLHRWL